MKLKIIPALALWVVCQLLYPIISLWMLVSIFFSSDRAYRATLAFDRLGNAITGGSDKETVSSRAYRGAVEGNWRWCLLCRILNWIDRDHCKKSEGT